jgi:hypothetical protein
MTVRVQTTQEEQMSHTHGDPRINVYPGHEAELMLLDLPGNEPSWTW